MSGHNFTPVTGVKNPRWNYAKEGNTKETQTPIAAGDNTWLVGYYVGAKEREHEGNVYLVHSVKFLEAGNPKSVASSDEVKQLDDVEFSVSGFANDALAKIEKGTLIRVHWTGKEVSKKNPSRSYNVFEIGADESAERFNFNTNQVGGVDPNAGNKAPEESLASDDSNDNWDAGDDPEEFPG